jgi:hypothetical protein
VLNLGIMKAIVIVFLIILTSFISRLPYKIGLAQSTNNQNSTLSIEIYARDNKGKRPASKTKFYLLDTDVEVILRNAGLTGVQPWGPVDSYGMAVWRSESSGEKELYKQKYKDFHAAADAALKPHIVQTVITDSKGEAQFEPFAPGTYYLLGVAQINKGFSIIRSQIEVKPGGNRFTF